MVPDPELMKWLNAGGLVFLAIGMILGWIVPGYMYKVEKADKERILAERNAALDELRRYKDAGERAISRRRRR